MSKVQLFRIAQARQGTREAAAITEVEKAALRLVHQAAWDEHNRCFYYGEEARQFRLKKGKR